jgi:hypothetical protein
MDVVLERDMDVLSDGQFLEYRRRLHLDAHAPLDALIWQLARNIGAVEMDVAGGRRIHADDEPKERALARAVRTDQAVDVASFDLKGDVRDSGEAAKGFRGARGYEKGGHRAYSPG